MGHRRVVEEAEGGGGSDASMWGVVGEVALGTTWIQLALVRPDVDAIAGMWCAGVAVRYWITMRNPVFSVAESG